MLSFRALWCCVLCIGASACSVHPIPFDVPGYNTVDIVRKIRCEAAKAIEKNILIGLKNNPVEQARYANAQIVYNYTFSITENNDVSAGADFKLPLTSRTFTLGINAGADRERSGSREFVVTDSFAETLEEIYEVIEVTSADGKKRKRPLARKPCAQEAKGENLVYPITGTIGLDETIRTFVQLNHLHLLDPRAQDFEFPDGTGPAAAAPPSSVPPAALVPLAQNLYSSAGKSKFVKRAKGSSAGKGDKKEAKTEEFSDELDFTTTIKVSASPRIELKSAKSGFRLTGADATISGQRTDRHKVIITLALPKRDETPGETRDRARDASDARVDRSIQESIAKALRR